MVKRMGHRGDDARYFDLRFPRRTRYAFVSIQRG